MPPSVLFMEEKDALRPAGNMALLQEEAMGDVARVAKVPSTMLVSAHGETMSVPRRCIGRPARIVALPGGSMDCYVDGELVAHHEHGAPIAGVAALGVPVGSDGVAVLAVPPRYVAEVGLDARFLVHVQLSDHVAFHAAGSSRLRFDQLSVG